MELAGEVVQAAKLGSKKVEDSMQRVSGLRRHPVMCWTGGAGRRSLVQGTIVAYDLSYMIVIYGENRQT